MPLVELLQRNLIHKDNSDCWIVSDFMNERPQKHIYCFILKENSTVYDHVSKKMNVSSTD